VTFVHDKKHDPKYASVPMTRYPHPDSNIATHVKLNVILSQAYRFKNLSSFREDFFKALTQLVRCFTDKGYQRKQVLKVTNRFFRDNVPIFGISSWSLLSRMLLKYLARTT